LLLDFLKKIGLSRILSVAVIVFLLARYSNTALDNLKKEGGFFPEIPLVDYSGRLAEIPPERARPWAVLFWATHCGPCRVEMELIQKSIDMNTLDSDRVLAVHIGGRFDVARDFMKAHGFTFPFYLDQGGRLAATLDVSLTPTLVLVDADRKISWVSSGLGVTHLFRLSSHLK
jgi:cytochrome c biogenesis protein CcmG/thiol:disulfide interchange protein DsbE